MQLRPLHPDFGVEVLDYDVIHDRSPASIEALVDAMDQHHMLLFRGLDRLAPEAQLEITRWFGPICDDGSGRLTGALDNESLAGSIRLPFHSDMTYTPSPLKGISLQAVAVPPGGTTTTYVSSAAAWDKLDADLQARLAPLTVRHRHLSDWAVDWPEFIAEHPMRFAHPRTGRPILLITEHHADLIPALAPAESEQLLKQLFEAMYAPERLYTHRWQLNDLLVWDNLALQHARTEEATLDSGAGVMQRVQIGDVGYGDLLKGARREQAERERRALETASN